MKGEKDDQDVDCREALHRVYHFLDGELTPERRDQIARHLDECSPCVQVFGFETEIRKLVADRCRDQVPDELRTADRRCDRPRAPGEVEGRRYRPGCGALTGANSAARRRTMLR